MRCWKRCTSIPILPRIFCNLFWSPSFTFLDLHLIAFILMPNPSISILYPFRGWHKSGFFCNVQLSQIHDDERMDEANTVHSNMKLGLGWASAGTTSNINNSIIGVFSLSYGDEQTQTSVVSCNGCWYAAQHIKAADPSCYTRLLPSASPFSYV